MNEKLRSVIKRVKVKLAVEPDSIIFGELNEGNPEIQLDSDYYKQYMEFLKEVNGGRCGAVDLWSFDELYMHQSRVTDYLGGTDRWLEVGQVLYEPLVIEKSSGQVYYFYQGYSDRLGQTLGDYDYFLLNYVFGRKYEELVPDAHLEEWYQFIKGLGLA
ncbi:hypothetical protein [Paenibacillus woosongensis]|uniref:SMI1/KNR4 family protein n=1 Tax=Paenibacillus woosongensis TaxID=307580 RepID=A0A7X2YYJ8_9BACL|nr:hypothetical protein [Paenibacillus woosongensis]MUG44312.1 hypothetical protein [Paenibacillus woosongensis]